MAQGAKPGEGGQLPGSKVYPWIAKMRHSTPGVGLISPPPHHDIYSIEDLAELIHDLKNANRHARISVKLVAEVGVGTVAAGVAKAHADVVLISGYDGGTGASPQTSIKHAGLPWELGLAETHQTLVLNNLRSRIAVETDGQLKTGRDVVIAALLGAEEFGFATAPLVALGLHHDARLPSEHLPGRRRDAGSATAREVHRRAGARRQLHALHRAGSARAHGAARLPHDRTKWSAASTASKPRKADRALEGEGPRLHATSCISPTSAPDVGRFCQIEQDHGLEKSLDITQLLELCEPAIERGEKVGAELPIRNVNRVVGTILGSEITRKYGADGSAGRHDPTSTSTARAGQSFGAFMPQRHDLRLEGDANDYVGKGLSGGKIIVYPPTDSTFVPEENIIIGNVALYGATSGEAYIRGMAGERFCVRNTGVNAVVEAVGDHGCEYMTGGRVVVLGPTGRNFARRHVRRRRLRLDEARRFPARCNMQMVGLEKLEDADEIEAGLAA